MVWSALFRWVIKGLMSTEMFFCFTVAEPRLNKSSLKCMTGVKLAFNTLPALPVINYFCSRISNFFRKEGLGPVSRKSR